MRKTTNNKCLLFIDETASTNIHEINANFGLTGIILKNNEYINKIIFNKVDTFKNEVFNNNNTLHLIDIVNKKNQYSNITRRHQIDFINKLPTLLKDINMDIISVVINKKELKHNNYLLKDLYEVAFSELLDSFYVYLDHNNITSAKIIMESRQDWQNMITQQTFFNIYQHGTNLRNIDETLKNRIKGFILAPKGDEEYGTGLELADIICNPLTRVRTGKKELNINGIIHNNNTIYNAIENKLFNIKENDKYILGYKLVPEIYEKYHEKILGEFSQQVEPKEAEQQLQKTK